MSYKKHFKNSAGAMSPISGANSNTRSWNELNGHGSDFKYRNYMSSLPEVYTGHPNRVERYNTFEQMDVDPEINACLDIISEFATQENTFNHTPFEIIFRETPTPNEVEILKQQLQQWCKLNELDSRIFKIFRNTIKYGDQVFIRDPENFKLYWIDMSKVIKVIVNESEGKAPEQYVIKDLNINLQNLTAAQKTNTDYAANPMTGYGGTGGGMSSGTGYGLSSSAYTSTTGSRFTLGLGEYAIDSKHVVHLSLTEGLDRFWPFGQSVLESIFKVYKQKELLEDAVLIYRVQRAPERRVFKIDVGNMNNVMAMAFIENVKNEIHQRRIPSPHGGSSVVDATYNPLSMLEDYYFPVTADGRGSSVEVLPSGCLAMDTKVVLLDGRELTIQEIATEIKEKELWTYSCNPETGKVVPGLISWAGVTQESAEVLKITLDNNEEIICTPDHKFPVYDKDFKRADQLKVGDSLVPLYRRTHQVSANTNEYEQFFDNETKEWQFTHRMVADELKDTKVKYWEYKPEYSNGNYEVRHHIDFNRFNNSPDNLCWMSSLDHFKFHSENMQQWHSEAKLNNPELYDEFRNKVGEGQKRHWQTMSEPEFSKRIEIQKEQNRKFNEKMNSDPEFYQSVMEKRMAYWTDDARKTRAEIVTARNLSDWSGEKGKQRKKKHSDLQSMRFSHDMLKFVINMVKGKSHLQVTADDVARALNNSDFKDELIALNKDNHVRNWKPEDGFTGGNIRRALVTKFGYSSWRDFRKKVNLHNHTIVSIEVMAEKIPVGTLTIDNDEIYHDYHTFALSCGVFTKNSNLGEIDDLRYWNNRLARGLRVPSSYLPTGPDDNTTPLSDGRVGTAMIQEFRFNQYCTRLQNYIARALDDEFKLFMRWRGLNIDSSLFVLKFNPPQNFAAYRQSELDSARVSTFTTMEAIPYISKRFAMERFLGLSEDEITKNEQLWREENDNAPDEEPVGSDIRNVGVSVGDFNADQALSDEIGSMEDMGDAEAMGDMGMETTGPVSEQPGGILPPE